MSEEFIQNEIIKQALSQISQPLLDEVMSVSTIRIFEAHTELVKEGQFVRVVPLVLKGLVKVFTHAAERELLLYYIQPQQSCILSFSSCLHNEKSNFTAVTDEVSTIMLMPAEKVIQWVTKHPDMNRLFYRQYDLRYSELIHTIQHLLVDKLDKRLLDYLQTKISISGQPLVNKSHKEIAADLGTAREVVSRLLKKLEHQGYVVQHHNGIELLTMM